MSDKKGLPPREVGTCAIDEMVRFSAQYFGHYKPEFSEFCSAELVIIICLLRADHAQFKSPFLCDLLVQFMSSLLYERVSLEFVVFSYTLNARKFR